VSGGDRKAAERGESCVMQATHLRGMRGLLLLLLLLLLLWSRCQC